jgi:sporulation protein YlmC with PRC-barrel domain
MNKALSVFAVVFVLGLMAFVVNSDAEGMATKGWDTHEVSQLLRCNVRNHDGQFLGRIEDFVVDSNGRIAFAIITQPGVLGIRGKPVAVPFETLTLGSEKNEFVLDMSWEKFASMPKFDQKADLGNRAWATEVYRSFGLEPYWTEE